MEVEREIKHEQWRNQNVVAKNLMQSQPLFKKIEENYG
jgi:hypothetical protein